MVNNLLYLITNKNILINLNESVRIVNFNPWGFSASKIQQQIRESIGSIRFDNADIILYYVEPLFFGRRSEIAFQYLTQSYPFINKIKFLKEDELILFFDNFSI